MADYHAADQAVENDDEDPEGLLVDDGLNDGINDGGIRIPDWPSSARCRQRLGRPVLSVPELSGFNQPLSNGSLARWKHKALKAVENSHNRIDKKHKRRRAQRHEQASNRATCALKAAVYSKATSNRTACCTLEARPVRAADATSSTTFLRSRSFLLHILTTAAVAGTRRANFYTTTGGRHREAAQRPGRSRSRRNESTQTLSTCAMDSLSSSAALN